MQLLSGRLPEVEVNLIDRHVLSGLQVIHDCCTVISGATLFKPGLFVEVVKFRIASKDTKGLSSVKKHAPVKEQLRSEPMPPLLAEPIVIEGMEVRKKTIVLVLSAFRTRTVSAEAPAVVVTVTDITAAGPVGSHSFDGVVENGLWTVTLPIHPAGGDYNLSVAGTADCGNATYTDKEAIVGAAARPRPVAGLTVGLR